MIPRRTELPRLSDRLPLGRTGATVSPLCLGKVRDPDTICAAFDAGINFFFLTADLHWPLYEASRRGLERLLARGRGIRDEVVVAVASYVTQPGLPSAALNELADAVAGLGRIDLAISGAAFASGYPARLQAFQKLRDSARLGIRAIGMTFHERRAVVQAVNDGVVDIAFARYNPLNPQARVDLFPLLHADRAALLFNFKSTLGFVDPERRAALGLVSDGPGPEITDYYRFALTRPQIDGLLCGPSTPGELRALALALEAGPLTEAEEQYLLDLGARYDAASRRRSPEEPGTKTPAP